VKRTLFYDCCRPKRIYYDLFLLYLHSKYSVTYSSARFLLKLIAGEAKDEFTGIRFLYVAAGTVRLSDLLKD